MSRARPSIKEIHEQLKDLVDWETFAIHLPKITPTEVKTIKKDFPLDNNRQKQALFDRWLHVYPNASWDAIILALENVDEDTIANNIRLYRKHIVTPLILSKPTKYEMKQKLKDLKQWERFAHCLPAVTSEHIDQIKGVIHDDSDDLKLHLFEIWLDVHPHPTWELIVQALKECGEKELAQKVFSDVSHEIKIEKDTIQELSELHDNFCSLSFKCDKAIKDLVKKGELTLEDLVLRTAKESTYTIEGLLEVDNVHNFLCLISKHCDFLNCRLPLALVKEFLNGNKLLSDLQTHIKTTKDFKNNSKIQHLQDFLSMKSLEAPVTIIAKTKEEHELRLVESLLITLLRLDSKDINDYFKVVSDPEP